MIAGLGLAGGIRVARLVRSPSGEVAAALRSRVAPADLVAYCPDQLGPSTARELPTRTQQVTFPRLESPRFVDWTDYGDRNAAASPRRFVAHATERAGAGRIWLVWSPGYRTLGTKCERVVDSMSASRAHAAVVLRAHGPDGEAVEVRRFDP